MWFNLFIGSKFTPSGEMKLNSQNWKPLSTRAKINFLSNKFGISRKDAREMLIDMGDIEETQ
jgi:hypothetical protein